MTLSRIMTLEHWKVNGLNCVWYELFYIDITHTPVFVGRAYNMIILRLCLPCYDKQPTWIFSLIHLNRWMLHIYIVSNICTMKRLVCAPRGLDHNGCGLIVKINVLSSRQLLQIVKAKTGMRLDSEGYGIFQICKNTGEFYSSACQITRENCRYVIIVVAILFAILIYKKQCRSMW